MGGYVGQPLQSVMVRYGAPVNVFDMPDGRRAFQWAIENSIPIPATSTTTASLYAPPGAYSATLNSHTTSYGGGVVNQRCLYTMYAKYDEASKAWNFVGYEKPRFMCE